MAGPSPAIVAGTAPLMVAVDRVEDAEQALDVRLRDSFGVNTIDFAVLRWVDRVHRRGGVVRVGDLAEHFGVSSGSATEIVHRLTRAGLLQRTTHPSDARVRRLQPTDEARRRMLELMGEVRADLDALLDALPEAEQRRIADLLVAVCTILEAERQPART